MSRLNGSAFCVDAYFQLEMAFHRNPASNPARPAPASSIDNLFKIATDSLATSLELSTLIEKVAAQVCASTLTAWGGVLVAGDDLNSYLRR